MSSTSPPPSNDVDVDDEVKQSEENNGTAAMNDIIESATINDVDEDKDGHAIGLKGITWDKMSAKQLRRLCIVFRVKGYKNAKKNETIDILKRWCFNKKIYQAMYKEVHESSAGAPRKEVQCAFRLMNILFSDRFALDFANIGNIATRESLDTKKAANDEHFWERVQQEFVTSNSSSTNNAYNQLHFSDDKIFDLHNHINPGKIVLHSWKKLRAMWKAVNAEYKAALSRYTVSGTHESDFFAFCKGNLETYYLRLHLQQRLELNGMVEADLPFHCLLSSSMTVAELRERGIGGGGSSDATSSGRPCGSDGDGEEPRNSSNSGGTALDFEPNKKRKVVVKKGLQSLAATITAENNAVATAIRDYGDSQMRAELAKQKLLYMQQEDSRRREKYHLTMWEKMQSNIRLLRMDLREIEGLPSSAENEAARNSIEREIEALEKKKNELATELGIDSCFN